MARIQCNYCTTTGTDGLAASLALPCIKAPRFGADFAVACPGLSQHLQTTVNIQSTLEAYKAKLYVSEPECVPWSRGMQVRPPLLISTR